MKIVKPAALLINEPDPFKQIEKVGRTCYKSEDKITDDSARAFVSRMKNSKHFAMLEHGWAHFYLLNTPEVFDLIPERELYVPYAVVTPRDDGRDYVISLSLRHLFDRQMFNNKFIRCCRALFAHHYNFGVLEGFDDWELLNDINRTVGVTNILSLVDKDDVLLLPEEHHFFTLKFTTDRGVSHEFVRHRVAVGQESTRYCLYTNEKFGAEVTFCTPSSIEEGTPAYDAWKGACERSEEDYFRLVNLGCTAQQARAALNNSTKTDVCLTMNKPHWEHFFNLRYFGTTGAPHPDAKAAAGEGIKAFDTIGINF